MFIRILRIVLGLALSTVGCLGLRDGERQLREWRAGGADLASVAQQAGGIAEASAQELDPGNENHLVHVVGPVSLQSPSDPLTGVAVPGFRLKRIVEMYQWEEHIRAGSQNSRTYKLGWNNHLIDSDQFHQMVFGQQRHVNPKTLPYKSDVDLQAVDLHLGAYRLDPGYLETVGGDWKPVPAKLLTKAPLAPGWNTAGGYLFRDGEAIGVGAVRIRYDYLPLDPQGYSLIAVQRGQSLSPEGVMGDQAAAIFEPGRRGVQRLLADFGSQVNSWGGQVRVYWWLWMSFGIALGLRPALQLAGRAPGFTGAPTARRLGTTLVVSGLAAGAIVAVVMLS